MKKNNPDLRSSLFFRYSNPRSDDAVSRNEDLRKQFPYSLTILAIYDGLEN